jgi:hypothetical protein
MATLDLRVWAVKGAEQRLVEIADEARAIFEAFPELRAQGRGFDLRVTGKRAVSEPVAAGAPRRRRRMSAAARKRIGDAQRKRWAAVRQKQSAEAPAKTSPKKAGRKKASA